MDQKDKETLLKVADYNKSENLAFSKRLRYLFWAGLAAFLVYMFLDVQGLTVIALYDDIASFMLGLVFGILLLGVLYTSRYMSKIQAFKTRLWKRNK